jgi:DNA polymerase-1
MLNCLVIDTETSIRDPIHGSAGKSPLNDFYTLIYGGHPDEIQVHHRSEGFGKRLPSKLLGNDSDVNCLVGHNLPFDCSYFLSDFKGYLQRGGEIWDTQYAEYLMSGQRHSMASLAELQMLYLDSKVKEDRISRLYKKGIGADKIIATRGRCRRLCDLYDKYCYDDGRTTLQVFAKQYRRAKEMGMLPIIKMYMKFLAGLILMQNEGIHVNARCCEETIRELKLKMIDELQKASELIKPYWTDERLPEFNVNSPQHKSAVLFGGYITCEVRKHIGKYKNGKDKYKKVKEQVYVSGFKLPKSLTRESEIEGRYVTDAAVIVRIANESSNEVAKQYCEHQKKAMNLNKMVSTYLESFLEKAIGGKLYPNLSHAFTITGRLSSSEPNMQNVPSHGDNGVIIQRPLVAPPGWLVVSADYSQLEIYVVAWLSGDQALQNDLVIGTDMHIKRLSYAEGVSYEEAYKNCKVDKLPGWDDKRSKAKTISYQKAYGAGVKSLSRTTGLSEEVVQRIFDQEDIEYFKVREFNERVAAECKATEQPSLARHFPAAKKKAGKNGKRFEKGIELLPIYDDVGNMYFNKNEIRHFGTYKSVTGRRYTWEEVGRQRRGRLYTGYPPTQLKNYPIQGSAADIVAAAIAELSDYCIQNPDTVKMILTIHDSVLFYIQEDKLKEHCTAIREIMMNVNYLPVKLPIPVPVEFKVGNNLGELTSYDIK